MAARAPTGDAASVPSPCIDLCRMNRETGFCEGCWRTMDEIAAWGMASERDKREVWVRITQRKLLSEGMD